MTKFKALQSGQCVWPSIASTTVRHTTQICSKLRGPFASKCFWTSIRKWVGTLKFILPMDRFSFFVGVWASGLFFHHRYIKCWVWSNKSQQRALMMCFANEIVIIPFDEFPVRLSLTVFNDNNCNWIGRPEIFRNLTKFYIFNSPCSRVVVRASSWIHRCTTFALIPALCSSTVFAVISTYVSGKYLLSFSNWILLFLITAERMDCYHI